MKDSDRNNAKNETPDIFIAVKHAYSKYLKIVNFSMETFKLAISLHVQKVGFELVSRLAVFGMSGNRSPKKVYSVGEGLRDIPKEGACWV